jgi:hypothetical protein
MAYLAHTSVSTTAAGAIPSLARWPERDHPAAHRRRSGCHDRAVAAGPGRGHRRGGGAQRHPASSALVFLILLANDKPVLGPWTNNRAQNWIGGLVVWAVTTFSLVSLVTTF